MPYLGFERVLTNYPGIGVARHVDAGYDIAKFVRTDLQGGLLGMTKRSSLPAIFCPLVKRSMYA